MSPALFADDSEIFLRERFMPFSKIVTTDYDE